MQIDPESRLELLRSLLEHEGWKIFYEKLVDEVGRSASLCTSFQESHAKWGYNAGKAAGLQDAALLIGTLISNAQKEIEKQKEI